MLTTTAAVDDTEIADLNRHAKPGTSRPRDARTTGPTLHQP
jgi:hypothetical protein